MKTCVSLYDESGNMLRPWAEAGYECYCLDLHQADPRVERVGKGSITYLEMDVLSAEAAKLVVELRPYFMFGFPPCTDVAVSGARHFERKMMDDPYCMAKTSDLAMRIPLLAHSVEAIWAFENPKSMLKHYIGDPDYTFHPFEFGGYLPENDIHPRWPEYIPPRDAYKKETWLWASPLYQFPPKAPVPFEPGWAPQMAKLGGTSAKTKQIRSETPRGFARANFMINKAKEV